MDLPLYPEKEVLPEWYFYKNVMGEVESDREFILARMAIVPDQVKQQVSDEYDRLYRLKQANHRELANKYLHNLAIEYRGKK